MGVVGGIWTAQGERDRMDATWTVWMTALSRGFIHPSTPLLSTTLLLWRASPLQCALVKYLE